MRRLPGPPPARQLGSVAWRYQFPYRRATNAAAWIGLSAGRRRLGSGGEVGQNAASREERLQRLEAVLFVAREPLSSRKLSDYANLADGTEARTLIRRLNKLYDDCGRAFRVEEVAGGFQLLSRPKFAPWLRRLPHVPGEARFSAPVLETLAVIAYRQPVLRADIEAIRGVNCGEILRQLMERDLVRISGRSQELGRPYLYSTTRKFLQLFGLSQIEKLPRVPFMRGDCGSPFPLASSGNVGDADGPQNQSGPTQEFSQEEESEVTVSIRELPQEERLLDAALLPAIAIAAQARDEDDDVAEEGVEDDEFDDDDDEDDDEDDDIDDEEFDDEEFDDEFDEEEDLDDEEEDEFEDDEWEEVEDDEEEDDWDDDDDEELDWDDDDDDEGDEEEEEEEVDWE